ncbi:bifunctional diaminohydroxyphosphoribosylaminopyrimidine deaminase/5-amino-6-(5-phosphoribosylamino)uracil reductase RibD [Shewanella sp. JM162201]|uniref:Riboflavin biosynthesis protein RibD n=1 Tax=Shewanella jiangmenensis TaxID=2837387 RepID=A0ABS5V0V2_9GAMM|nr:bifunctional diaminohydroxyphosphoribosylaminopyrimidine deaminase/5-amino-6-(5-phosphoribosylamino)uracil reductase RibD [Shewanella jiangmenensis]MBT1443396.1 bifunctional diaminohydroxyphosphoribosylaminopyrimidine deaminase/5-amino-6-(5-phosphoribosylamino)uracil reductase RibD [Shewanella jiangmenensis]
MSNPANSQFSSLDHAMMARAIMLAKRGQYTTRPNPNVGCVIVNDTGDIVGEGWHIRAGGPHAEVHALRQAGDRARGATAYVTLEPCSHYGRTPPCAKALTEHGLKRVVVAMTDPNPQVAGRGLKLLNDAGIEVAHGLMEAEARALNPGFLSRMERGRPFVTVKVGASLDGKTALSSGESKWITGPESRRDVQRLRAKSCALITGIDTVLLDDPSLNVRHGELGSLGNNLTEAELIQPIRVVLDSKQRMSANAKLFGIAGPILLVSTAPYDAHFLQSLPEFVTCLTLPGSDGRIDLAALLNHLGENCNRVLVEAGGTLAGAFIGAGLCDELVLYQAPKLLGSHGRDMLQLPDYQTMAELPGLKLIDERKLGQDWRFSFTLA